MTTRYAKADAIRGDGHRLQIVAANADQVLAFVRSDHGIYLVRWSRNEGWRCDCGAYGECSHREAVRSVTMRNVRRVI
ncbi:MAG TPA: hypothetical protein VNG12_25615 [Acidimicrobiales bacterium]|nr:hypothetical protein [Acidimicrobiales bacterium]